MRLREYAKAETVFRQMAALAPQEPRGPTLLGIALRAQGKTGEARAAFEKALEMAPGYAEPLAELAALDLAAGKPDAALARVRTQVERVPESGQLHALLGRVHASRKEQAPAEAAYLKALELNPDLVGVYGELAQLYGTAGRYDAALASLDKLIAKNPSNASAFMLQGVLHELRNDVAKATAAYEKALQLRPRSPAAANNLAYLLTENGGDADRALGLAQTAKELAPDDPNISDTLGWILLKRGVIQRALALLTEASSKLPNNAEVLYHLGLAQQRAGQPNAARQSLQRALLLGSNFRGSDEARKALGQLP
jgi:Flp pilus assembly protein TadD